jgi:isopentenyl phosphate kinase
LRAGLIPVLHGDACLYGSRGAGILSGDTVMEMIGRAPWVSRAIFLTDVDGVFTKDPKSDPSAQLLQEIAVSNGDIVAVNLEASGSTHEHDVTGGLKVR